MTTRSCLDERLREPAARALDRYGRARAAGDARRGQPPRPGEVFAFPETAEHAVFWTVVAEDQERFVVVATDLEPFVGSTDVETSDPGTEGAWCLRCAVAVRLRAADFEAAHRTAFLAPEVIERVRARRAAIAAGEPVGSVLEQETDAEPEYQDWVEELERARAALCGKRALRPGTVVEFRPPRRRQWLANPYALAASILLGVALGLSAGVVWQQREADRREQEYGAREEGYREEIAELRRRLAGPDFGGPEVNVPFALLIAAGAQRGEVRTLAVSSTARSVLLILDTREDYPRYRLEIGAPAEGVPIWSSDELRKVGRLELTVALPRRLFPDGEYRLRLAGLGADGAEPLGEYALRIESR